MEQKPETVEVFPAELLAAVGHEFRGPLTTIQGYATTLLHHESQLTADERREFLHAINEASAHLGKLVDRFLELAQLETQTHPFEPEPVSLLTLVQEAITAAQKNGPHHLLFTPSPAQRLALHEGSEKETGDEWTLSGDRRLLRVLLDILLENAQLYSAPGSLVEVSLESTDAVSSACLSAEPGKQQEVIVPARFRDQERVLALYVRDHGMGIEPAHLALIFRRFYRVDTGLTRETNGLGLGLALCQAIVALHQGMLQVESALGEGSTFAVVFPRTLVPEVSGHIARTETGKKRMEENR